MLDRLFTFLRDQRANVTVLVSVTLPVVLMFSGIGVDFTVKEKVRRTLQDVVDSATLAAARADSEEEREEIAEKFAADNFAGEFGAHDLKITVEEDEDTGDMLGTARVEVPNTFGRFFGIDESVIMATASVRSSAPPLEVMLVLDRTGSMSGAKLEALKSAATELVETMMDGELVRVGIVPFAQYVNIGKSLRSAPGFSIPADYTECKKERKTIKSNERNCRTIHGTCYNDGLPYACSWRQCDYDYSYVDEEVCRDYKWNGCVGSREAPNNALDDNLGIAVPGIINVSCGSAITRLTTNKTKVKNGIKALSAGQNTYIPSGLMMGWHALTYRDILPDGVDPSSPDGRYMQRAIVLMTDGANTLSKDSGKPTHNGSDVTAANTLTRTLCTNIKADGIAIYTVAFDVSDSTITGILNDCASSSGAAFTAEDREELSEAFASIGRSLSRLRLVR